MRIDRTDIRTSKLTKVADGHARFFERRGMPVPETSNHISFGGVRK